MMLDANVLTKVDAWSGFWQIPLIPEFRPLNSCNPIPEISLQLPAQWLLDLPHEHLLFVRYKISAKGIELDPKKSKQSCKKRHVEDVLMAFSHKSKSLLYVLQTFCYQAAQGQLKSFRVLKWNDKSILLCLWFVAVDRCFFWCDLFIYNLLVLYLHLCILDSLHLYLPVPMMTSCQWHQVWTNELMWIDLN